MKICQENPNVIKIRQKYGGNFHTELNKFWFAGDINWPKNHCFCKGQYFYVVHVDM